MGVAQLIIDAEFVDEWPESYPHEKGSKLFVVILWGATTKSS